MMKESSPSTGKSSTRPIVVFASLPPGQQRAYLTDQFNEAVIRCLGDLYEVTQILTTLQIYTVSLPQEEKRTSMAQQTLHQVIDQICVVNNLVTPQSPLSTEQDLLALKQQGEASLSGKNEWKDAR